MLQNPRVLLLIVMALVFGAILFIWKTPARLGLDLQGGTRLTLEAVETETVKTITSDVMDTLHFIIDKRVNSLGISESIVQKAGDKRLLVEIPGVTDPDEAKRMLGRVGNLEFKRQVVENGKPEWVSSGVSGKDLSKADIAADQTGNWRILFELNSQGTDKFGTLTAELSKKQEPLGIFFDGKLVSAPSVNTPILQGSGEITGSFTHKDAKELADTLNAGALPVSIKVIEESTVGPLLGASSIEQSLFAGLVGMAIVMVFMMFFYRLQGLVANTALLVYTLLTYALFLTVGVTFTLAGIAGFILSIGMAVDANILIFERTKEEIKNGRTIGKAVDLGFERAFPSILDSNTTTIITCALLWFLGTGSVKGFALTLAIGVAVSMFSAITVTRTFLHLVTSTGGIAPTPWLFGVNQKEVSTLSSQQS